MTEPEQTFLAKHYEALAKDPNQDPRARFRQPTVGDFAAAGVVGPLGGQNYSILADRGLGQSDNEDISARIARMTSTVPARRVSSPSRVINTLDLTTNYSLTGYQGWTTSIIIPRSCSIERHTYTISYINL